MNTLFLKSVNERHKSLKPRSIGLRLVLLFVVLANSGCFSEPNVIPPPAQCTDIVLLELLRTDGPIIPGDDVTFEWVFTYTDEFTSSVEVDEVVSVELSPSVPCQIQPLVREDENLAGSLSEVDRSAQLSELMSCIDQVQGSTEMTVTVEYQNVGCAVPNASITRDFTFLCGACAGGTATRSELVATSVQVEIQQGSPVLIGTVGFEVDFCEAPETEPEMLNVQATLSILRSNNPICISSTPLIDQIDANGEAEVSVAVDGMLCETPPESGDVLQLEVLVPGISPDCGIGDLDSNNIAQSTL